MTPRWLGLVPYREAHAAQVRHRDALIRGEAGEELWLLEHPPVITLGRRGGDVDRVAARDAGYEIVETERGGLATVHEPGQLVGYLLMDVRRIGVRRIVEAVEEGLVRWTGGRRREGFPGVWRGDEKLAAIGLHVSRCHTMHGFALNLSNSRRGFTFVTACGIADAKVGAAPGRPAEVWEDVGRAVVSAVLDARAAGT